MRRAGVIACGAVVLALLLPAQAGASPRGYSSSLIVRYTMSPGGGDAISVADLGATTAELQLLRAAETAAGVSDRTNTIVRVHQSNDDVLRANIDGRLPSKVDDGWLLSIDTAPLGEVADRFAESVVVEVCASPNVDGTTVGLLRLRSDNGLLHCGSGRRPFVHEIAPGAASTTTLRIKQQPTWSRVISVWFVEWLIAAVFTLVFWGIARLLRRWLLPNRVKGARATALVVGVAVAALGFLFAGVTADVSGLGQNVALMHDNGQLVELLFSVTIGGVGLIAGLLFLFALLPRYQPLAPPPPAPATWSPPTWTPPLPPSSWPTTPPTANPTAMPNIWEPAPPLPPVAPPAPSPVPLYGPPPSGPAYPPPPAVGPPPPAWGPPPMGWGWAAPPRELEPAERSGKLALVLGMFGGVVPVLGALGALWAGHTWRADAPRRSRAARILGFVQLGAVALLALVSLIP